MKKQPMTLCEALEYYSKYFVDVPDANDPTRPTPDKEEPEPWPTDELEVFHSIGRDDQLVEEKYYQLERALLNGDVILEARLCPVDKNMKPEPVPKEDWGFLKIDRAGNKAIGGGVEYVNLQFWPKELWHLQPDKKVGRPTYRAETQGKFLERKDAGVVLGTLIAEAQAISDILKLEIQGSDGRGLGVHAVASHIRSKYNEWKSQK